MLKRLKITTPIMKMFKSGLLNERAFHKAAIAFHKEEIASHLHVKASHKVEEASHNKNWF